ncbi:hypothetical protein ABZP36_014340 [Zizania latifolia]
MMMERGTRMTDTLTVIGPSPSGRVLDAGTTTKCSAPWLVDTASLGTQGDTAIAQLEWRLPLTLSLCASHFCSQGTGILPQVAKSQASLVIGAYNFHCRLEKFLIQVSAALPQLILPTPPKVQRIDKHKTIPTVTRRSSRLAAKNPSDKGSSALALQVLNKKLGLSANSSESPSQKLASFFKQPISPATVRAIRDLVSFGGGQALMHSADKDAAITSA